MKSIWVVEHGSYSDYRVVGVFSSEENAKAIADAMNADPVAYDKATVGEWPLNPGVKELNAGLQQWHVQMHHNGDIERAAKEDHFSPYSIEQRITVWERSKAPAYVGKGIPNLLQAAVWAKDQKHAIKIANEYRLQMIAAGTFTTGL